MMKTLLIPFALIATIGAATPSFAQSTNSTTSQLARADQQLLARVKAKHEQIAIELGLNTKQKAAWDAIGAAQLTALVSAKMALSIALAQVKTDLANPNSNLRATQGVVYQTADQLIATNRRIGALKMDFFEQLSPAQQAQVRTKLLDKIDDFESMIGLLQRFGSR